MAEQGAYGVGNGPFCAVGAIRKASVLVEPFNSYQAEVIGDQAVEALTNELERHGEINDHVSNLIRWNDENRRTQDEVVRAMKRAVVELVPRPRQ